MDPLDFECMDYREADNGGHTSKGGQVECYIYTPGPASHLGPMIRLNVHDDDGQAIVYLTPDQARALGVAAITAALEAKRGPDGS